MQVSTKPDIISHALKEDVVMAAARAVAEELLNSILGLVKPHAIWGFEEDVCLPITSKP